MIRILLCLGLVTLAYSESYQTYIDEQLVGAGLSTAAIVNVLGYSVSAASPGFSVDTRALISLFNEPTAAFTRGITVGGVKYVATKADSQLICGKKGAGGVILVKTEKNIIVGVYNESLQFGNAANIVEKFGDYFRDNGL